MQVRCRGSRKASGSAVRYSTNQANAWQANKVANQAVISNSGNNEGKCWQGRCSAVVSKGSRLAVVSAAYATGAALQWRRV